MNSFHRVCLQSNKGSSEVQNILEILSIIQQFRKRQFVRDKNTQKNASIFAIFIEKENPRSFAIVYVDIW